MISTSYNNRRLRILVADDETSIRDGVVRLLSEEGYRASAAATGIEALSKIEKELFDVIILDLKMPKMNGLEVLKRLKAHNPDAVVLMMTAYPTVKTAVEAIKLGAYDYLPKPFSMEQFKVFLARAVERRLYQLENERLRHQLATQMEQEFVFGESPAISNALRMVYKVAATDSTVLLQGESGTGKELFARLVHANSSRKDQEFVTIDCATLVESLVENELFGHVGAAFTGAHTSKKGLFELANGGTCFLDEIGVLNLNMQTKLLRLIQQREMKRVGDTKWINIDVRIIAATNMDLGEGVKRGDIRKDLYYRLSVFPIHLPPLRERVADIPLLSNHFLNVYNRMRRRSVTNIHPEAMAALCRYNWPGNVREMMNTIERAVILEEGDTLTTKNLPWPVSESVSAEYEFPFDDDCRLCDVERLYIQRVLQRTGGNRSKAAKTLGIDRKTLYRKIKIYNIKE